MYHRPEAETDDEFRAERPLHPLQPSTPPPSLIFLNPCYGLPLSLDWNMKSWMPLFLLIVIIASSPCPPSSCCSYNWGWGHLSCLRPEGVRYMHSSVHRDVITGSTGAWRSGTRTFWHEPSGVSQTDLRSSKYTQYWWVRHKEQPCSSSILLVQPRSSSIFLTFPI